MSWPKRLIILWGVLGIGALLGQALVRLTPLALYPIAEGMLSPWQGGLYLAWVVFNAHAEGYRGFQRRFSPRAVARAFHLARHARPVHVALAPLFCMSLFHASRRGLTLAWSLLVGIVALIVLVRALPQPWRGIVDGGVVVGLGWGLASLLVLLLRAFVHGPPRVDPQLPQQASGGPDGFLAGRSGRC